MNGEVRKSKSFRKTINTKFVNDDKLSLKAMGIMIYLLSKQNGWRGQLYDMAKNTTNGKSSVRAGIKELVACGYAKLKTNPMKDGKFQGKYYVFSDKKGFFNED